MKLLLLLNLFSFITITQQQDNIFTITPNNSVCIGESVVITCYLFPPSPGDYTGFALLSFNGSTPEGFGDINTQFGSIGYVANITIPVMGDSARIQLNVTSFQVSDNNTVFGCHVQLSSNGLPTPALESGSASLADPPSSPVVTLSQTDNSCSNTLISWSTPSSNRSVTSYSVYRDGVSLYNGPDNQYTDNTQLTINTVYEYSVVAISCAGSSTAGVNTVSIGVPSSPVITISQTDNSCSNTRISWSISDADIPILRYLTYRNNTLIYNGTNTETIDNTQLNISTVYEYSVVAISCAGSSTGVNTTSIAGTSLANNSPLTIRYDNTTNELFVDWTLNPSQLITVTYNLSLVYIYTQNNETFSYNETEIFSQESTDTNNTLALRRPTFSSTNESVEFVLTATLRITQQCNTIITDGTVLTAYITTEFTPSATTNFPVGAIIGIVVVVVVCCLFCGSVLVLIILMVYVSKKKGKGYSIFNPKKRSDSQDLEEPTHNPLCKRNKNPKQQPVVEMKMEGLYAEVDHTLPKPDTIKRSEPIEETLYTQVHAIDGPNH